ncbi:MAG TPA: GGDEF domain-containing protein [Longimicrobiales bacterium]|nr:GGDEF domain-containing protein [Longimicrobiales bacterium]
MGAMLAIHSRLQAAPPAATFAVALVLVAVVGGADYATGVELSSSIFYIVPVTLAAWYGSLPGAVLMCVVASATWYGADQAAGNVYSASWIPLWNTGVRFLVLLLFAEVLSQLRHALEAQRRLAERDSLTGLANGRRFRAAAATEVARSQRYRRPLSLAYIDLDGFKALNDGRGHGAGDDVLETVGTILRRSLRAMDLPARLGGDEFAVLFPETDAVQAREAAMKLRVVLETAMDEAKWPVGFSMGVYTATGGVADAEELIRLADGLMYEVKHAGKGHTLFRTEGEPPTTGG